MMVRKVSLGCGAVSSLLYVAMNIVCALVWPGYSLRAQTISELSAIGAPSRPLWLALELVYYALVAAFGWGVWLSAGGKRALRVVSGLLIGPGVFLGVTSPFTSMHRREVLAAGGHTLTDTLHLVCATVWFLSFLATMGFGAATFGKRFRNYSVGSILTFVVFFLPLRSDLRRLRRNEPTPWMGVTERLMFVSPLLWFAMLSIGLLRAQRGRSPK
jgi:hypothetical protein